MAAKKKTAAAPSNTAQRLYDLFVSNQRSVGKFDPKTGRMRTEYHAPTVQDFIIHMTGAVGLGCVPILDDATCRWAAIDIDNHGDDEDDIPIAPIDDKIKSLKLPLIACRSKSGGVHVYAFFLKPQPASKVRGMMDKWAIAVGHKGVEVFPKQNKLLKGKNGKQQLGNWINLPYMGGDNTVRYAYRNGKRQTLVEFITLAEKALISEDEVSNQVLVEHGQAPPCVQRMLTEGVPVGNRNEALYGITIYLKRAFPDDYEERAMDTNASVFGKPLPRPEAGRTIVSAGRPDYSYRCHEEPCRSLCDKDKCVKRKFGITRNEFDLLSAKQALPIFTNMTKFLSDPVRWEFKIDGALVTNMGTEALLSWKMMRIAIADKLTRVAPNIKDEEWQRILQPLMDEARIIEAPDDASISGVIRERLREFAGKTDLLSKGENLDERKSLLRGVPCVIVSEGERCVAFRSNDFINYLKRTKSEELKGVNLWFSVRELGVRHTKLRVGDHNINLWCIPIKEIIEGITHAEPPNFKSSI